MIIDMHTHTFPDKIAYKTIAGMEKEIKQRRPYEHPAILHGSAGELENSMKQNGIDLSVVLPVATREGQQESINRFAAAANEQWKKTGIFSFGAIHPDDGNYREILQKIRENGMKGIKIHPDYQQTEFDDIRYMRIMEYATQLGLIIVTHAGEDIGLPGHIHCTPDMVCRVMRSVQPEKLVLAHMGGWNMWDEFCEKLAGEDLYIDTAFCHEKSPVPHLTKEGFEKVIRAHGADKVLFATDSPWSHQGEYAEFIKSLSLTQVEKNAILGDNAKKLLEL